jgi:hypothetical protein
LNIKKKQKKELFTALVAVPEGFSRYSGRCESLPTLPEVGQVQFKVLMVLAWG